MHLYLLKLIKRLMKLLKTARAWGNSKFLNIFFSLFSTGVIQTKSKFKPSTFQTAAPFSFLLFSKDKGVWTDSLYCCKNREEHHFVCFFLFEGLIVSQMKQLYTSIMRGQIKGCIKEGGAETTKHLVKYPNSCKNLTSTEKKKGVP